MYFYNIINSIKELVCVWSSSSIPSYTLNGSKSLIEFLNKSDTKYLVSDLVDSIDVMDTNSSTWRTAYTNKIATNSSHFRSTIYYY